MSKVWDEIWLYVKGDCHQMKLCGCIRFIKKGIDRTKTGLFVYKSHLMVVPSSDFLEVRRNSDAGNECNEGVPHNP